MLPMRIRSIEFIKHNPNIFHVPPTDLNIVYQILGGNGWLSCTLTGAGLGYLYFARKVHFNPVFFYQNIMLIASRIVFGGFIGGYAGYIKFGDRQRLHNAWVAERLRRRYPESMGIDEKNIWRFKGITPEHEFYKWT